MKKCYLALTIAFLLALPACRHLQAEETGEHGGKQAEGEKAKPEKIALDKLPKAVLDAAQGAVKGIVLTEAVVKKTDKGTVYEINGKADGKEYEIIVSAEGKVLKVKQEVAEADEKAGDEKENKSEKGGKDDKDDND